MTEKKKYKRIYNTSVWGGNYSESEKGNAEKQPRLSLPDKITCFSPHKQLAIELLLMLLYLNELLLWQTFEHRWVSKMFSWNQHTTPPWRSAINSRHWTEIDSDWIKCAARWPRDQRNCIDGRFQDYWSLAGCVCRSSGDIWDTVGITLTRHERRTDTFWHYSML